MKIVYLYILLIISTTSIYAQSNVPVKRTVPSIGDELIKAQNNGIAAIVLDVCGAGMLIAIPEPKYNSKGEISNDQMRNGLKYLGITLLAGGLVCQISAWTHMGRAGTLMNKQNIGISLNDNGIGLKIRLGKG